MNDSHPHNHNHDPHDDPNAVTFMGLAVSITEVDPKTAAEKGEVMFNVAQDLERGIVFIALTDVGTERLDFREGQDSVGVQRVFEIGLMDWAKFNAGLQQQLREQMLAHYGIPANLTPEQSVRSLLDGMGAEE